MFFTAGPTIYQKPHCKFTKQNCHLFWVSLIRLWTTQSRSFAVSLAKSIYYTLYLKFNFTGKFKNCWSFLKKQCTLYPIHIYTYYSKTILHIFSPVVFMQDFIHHFHFFSCRQSSKLKDKWLKNWEVLCWVCTCSSV